METVHASYETSPSTPEDDAFLGEYAGYDNPNLLGKLRADAYEATKGKNAEQSRLIRNRLINKYLNTWLDLEGMPDDEADEAYHAARKDVRYWLNLSHAAWNGEADEDGALVGNGVYHELVDELRNDPLANPDALVIRTQEMAQAHADAVLALDGSRSRLAELQAGFRHKFGFNGRKRRAELTEAKQQYQDALTRATKAGFDLLREEHPELTPEDIKQLALIAYANEFHDLLEEQKNPEHVKGTYGKLVRKLGNMSMPKKLLVGAASAGAGAAVALTGGALFAASAIGLLGFRVGKVIAAGPLGHSSDRGTDRIISKVTDKKNAAAEEALRRAESSTSDEDYARAIGAHVLESVKRIDRSDRNRRIASGVATTLALVPGIFGTINKINKAHELREIKGAIKDHVTERAANQTRRIPNQYDDLYAPHQDVVTPPVDLAPVAPMPTAEQFASLDRLVNAHGAYPWSRAADFFNGDNAAANEWIKQAATKAGAKWHNPGTVNAWLEIDGRSDTDYVWGKLVEASLRP